MYILVLYAFFRGQKNGILAICQRGNSRVLLKWRKELDYASGFKMVCQFDNLLDTQGDETDERVR